MPPEALRTASRTARDGGDKREAGGALERRLLRREWRDGDSEMEACRSTVSLHTGLVGRRRPDKKGRPLSSDHGNCAALSPPRVRGPGSFVRHAARTAPLRDFSKYFWERSQGAAIVRENEWLWRRFRLDAASTAVGLVSHSGYRKNQIIAMQSVTLGL